MRSLIVFDFDGVIADSELLANTVLAEAVSQLGVPTSLEDAYHRYMGKRFSEVISAIESDTGRRLPESFPEEIHSRVLDRFRQELRAVEGAKDYIDAFADIPKCIASTSTIDRLHLCLGVLGLEAMFGQHVYSASIVSRGKPYPDIFLYAAKQMGIPPARSIVIEDSPHGVAAGVAAGMTVIGLLAASHIQRGTRARLQAAGAHYVADTFGEVGSITRDIIAKLPDN